ncbi:hypothetical protein MJO28_005357 [Puccinia striiformis f. sp. tritici]|uniref:Uncharacterized protein n=1 Tax=Puccinia striiformis f. sp. tritici TaxID=168172 RepID=A0ACC0ELP4_9BASI|nr:hypothetical protein MJO28_005357 [Puccinia striiformis f. sp. tritici]
MDIVQLTLLVFLAGVCKSVISGRIQPPVMEAACCTTGDLDHADVCELTFHSDSRLQLSKTKDLVYPTDGILQDKPHNKNNDCYKTPDEIPYECPKGVLPPVLSIKLREANARGCHKRE